MRCLGPLTDINISVVARQLRDLKSEPWGENAAHPMCEAQSAIDPTFCPPNLGTDRFVPPRKGTWRSANFPPSSMQANGPKWHTIHCFTDRRYSTSQFSLDSVATELSVLIPKMPPAPEPPRLVSMEVTMSGWQSRQPLSNSGQRKSQVHHHQGRGSRRRLAGRHGP